MGYFKRGQLIERPFTVTTSGGTTTLTANTQKVIRCTGSQLHTIQLPSAVGLDLNHGYMIRNQSTATIHVTNSAGTLVANVPKGLDYGFYVSSNGSAPGSWDVSYSGTADDSPLKLHAGTPPDTKIYIETNSKLALDGTGLKSPPIKSLIPTITLSSFDFSTGATSGSTFLGGTLPSVTSGQYIRVGFTLLSSGSIQMLWSAAGASLAALVNPGTLFIKSGLPLGYVDLVSYDSAGRFKTAGSSSNVIENSVNDTPCIWRFGSGAGGSGSSGDASTVLESLKNQFEKSYFQLLTPGIFIMDQSTKVDGSSTGAYSLVDDTFNFTAAGQTLITTNLLDANEFLNNSDPLAEMEISAYWSSGYIDTGATYEVTRNNGRTWETISMSRVGSSTDLYRGYQKFTTSYSDVLYNIAPTPSGVTELNTTTAQMIAQPFTASSTSKYLLQGLMLMVTKKGSPSGNLYISVCSDNSGSVGSVLCETTAISASGLTNGSNQITLPDIYLPAGTSTYYLKIRTDAAYQASFVANTTSIQIQGNTSGSPALLKQYNGTTGTWSVGTQTVSVGITGQTIALKLRITSSQVSKMVGYGVFYDKSIPASVASGTLNIQEFEFSGSSNTYQFTLTKFLPSPDLLRVYDVFTAQCYVYGAFAIQGSTVVFDSGQFYQPGQTVRLRFIQTEGTVFDNSDVNGLLLAANALGSTDPRIDRSIAGRGIFLRRPDGTLREITIDNNDQIVVYSV